MKMKLTENFSLKEMTQSQTALKNNIDNEPNAEQIENLRQLCKTILQPLREDFQLPIKITSGFRSPELCQLIGSKPTSQHCANECAAADFEIPGIDNKKVFRHIIENLPYDQIILEYYDESDINSGWIHVSWSLHPRGQALTKDKEGYKTWQ
jgi:zinc D-Ala-D-Ala carboxypeptidase